MADDEGFVRRWSRRKSAAREQARAAAGEPAREPAAEGADAAPAPAPAETSPARVPEPAVDLDSLPDIESLTYESDYTVFLRKGVPAELRKRALARLWRSDPVLANLDGLLEYGEDYTKIGTVKSVVRTAYQVGRGMLHDRASESAEQTAGPGAAPQPAAEAPVAAPAEPPPAAADHGDRAAADAEPTSTKDPRTGRA